MPSLTFLFARAEGGVISLPLNALPVSGLVNDSGYSLLPEGVSVVVVPPRVSTCG